MDFKMCWTIPTSKSYVSPCACWDPEVCIVKCLHRGSKTTPAIPSPPRKPFTKQKPKSQLLSVTAASASQAAFYRSHKIKKKGWTLGRMLQTSCTWKRETSQKSVESQPRSLSHSSSIIALDWQKPPKHYCYNTPTACMSHTNNYKLWSKPSGSATKHWNLPYVSLLSGCIF